MIRFRDTITRTQSSLLTRIGDRRWLLRWGLPALGTLVVLGVGWWTYRAVEASAKEALVQELQGLRDAVATAVRIWLRQQETFADVLANQPSLQADAKALLELHAKGLGAAGLRQAESQNRLRGCLAPALSARKYARFRLMAPDGTVLSSSLPELVGQTMPIVPQPDLLQRLNAGQAVVSRPFRDRFVIDDPKKGKESREEPGMIVAAPLREADGKPYAYLSFQLRPDEEFSRIFNAPQTGRSIEAYAFDAKGLLLTQSRFDEQVRAVGLIPPDAASLLALELRNPGANLAAGERSVSGRFQQPLTKAATEASAGRTGVDADGYADYLGVPSVGAWTWLPDHGFGIIIEEDATEAFAPLVRLQWVFGVVFALLLLAGAGDIASTFVIAKQQKRLRQAVRESRKLGHYTLEEKLGEGGMGEVYRGSHALLRRQVAIKLLKPELGGDRAVARFEREVQLTSRLQHPNTIAIYDYGRTPEGVFYYVMEHLEGMTLEKLVRSGSPLPAARVIHLLTQICGSLEEAHSQGLIHRDIKPANVMACRRYGHADVIKVLDFGLVKDVGGDNDQGKTLSEGIAGTPLYLAPEAIQDPDHNGPSRDLYAVGATGYFLLTGHTVFEGRNLLEVCNHHVHTPPPALAQRLGRSVDADLEAIILKCLAKRPEERYPSAAALGEALAGCAAARAWTRAAAEAAWKAMKPAPTAGADAPTPLATQIEATMDFQPQAVRP